MPATVDLGDDYSIDEDGSDLIIRHDPSGSELRFDSVDELFEFASQARFTDSLVDSNGKTIYDVSTGTVGDGNTSADHESVSTGTLSINEAKAYVTKSTEQTVSASTSTKLTWDATQSDSSVITADLTNNQFVFNESGDYILKSQLRWENKSGWSTGDIATPRVAINGSNVNNPRKLKIGTVEQGVQIVALVSVSSNDTASVNAFQNSGGDATIRNGQANTHFWGVKVA